MTNLKKMGKSTYFFRLFELTNKNLEKSTTSIVFKKKKKKMHGTIFSKIL